MVACGIGQQLRGHAQQVNSLHILAALGSCRPRAAASILRRPCPPRTPTAHPPAQSPCFLPAPYAPSPPPAESPILPIQIRTSANPQERPLVLAYYYIANNKIMQVSRV